jgi:hypothetical protein
VSILSALTNVTKAGIAVTLAPVALVADILTLPASAHDNKSPFHRTSKMLDAAGKCAIEATKHEA